MAYEEVNDQWPDNLPVPTGQEAIAAVKRLYRFAMKRPFRGKFKLTSGRRYTYPRSGVYMVNPAGHHFGGWRDLVHDVSHHCHIKLWRGKHEDFGHHDVRHRKLERDMVAYVIEHGWLDGKLRREPKPKPNPVTTRHTSVVRRIRTWESKAKRADNALRKLRRQLRYYEKVEASN